MGDANMVPPSLDLSQKGLSPELVERMDYVVELIGFGSREELVRCAVRRYIDTYFPIGKNIFHRSYDVLEKDKETLCGSGST